MRKKIGVHCFSAKNKKCTKARKGEEMKNDFFENEAP